MLLFSAILGCSTDVPDTDTGRPTPAVPTPRPGEDAEPFGGGTCASVEDTLSLRCATCHGAGSAFEGLVTDDLSALVNREARQSDGLLVVPGDPDASYLMHKLWDTHETVGGRGTIMPPSRMEDARVAGVRAWIEAGAVCP